jgi:hypothetical protein
VSDLLDRLVLRAAGVPAVAAAWAATEVAAPGDVPREDGWWQEVDTEGPPPDEASAIVPRTGELVARRPQVAQAAPTVPVHPGPEVWPGAHGRPDSREQGISPAPAPGLDGPGPAPVPSTAGPAAAGDRVTPPSAERASPTSTRSPGPVAAAMPAPDPGPIVNPTRLVRPEEPGEAPTDRPAELTPPPPLRAAPGPEPAPVPRAAVETRVDTTRPRAVPAPAQVPPVVVRIERLEVRTRDPDPPAEPIPAPGAWATGFAGAESARSYRGRAFS